MKTIKIGKFTIISGLAHSLKFEDGSILEANPDLAKVIKTTPVEEQVDEFRVMTKFAPDPGAVKFLNSLPEFTLVVTSIIGLEILNYHLVSPVTTPETTRLPPEQKICFKNKWNVKTIFDSTLMRPFH